MNKRLVRVDLYFDGKLLKPGSIVKIKNSYGTYRFVGLFADMDSGREEIICMSLKDRALLYFHPSYLLRVVGKRSRRGKD